MKADPRRIRMLERMQRVRRVERIRALGVTAAATAELTRLERLNARSQVMLENTRLPQGAVPASGLASTLTFQIQLSTLAGSTKELSGAAQARASDARDRLHKAERRLEHSAESVAREKRALDRRAEQRAATIGLARRLQSSFGRNPAQEDEA